MKKCINLVIIVALLCAFSGISFAQTNNSQSSNTSKQYAASEDWQKDINKKLESAMKVLAVIKEELNSADFSSLPAASSVGSTDPKEEIRNWSAAIRKFYAAASRAWKKIKKELPEDQQAAFSKQAVSATQQDKDWSKDVSVKLQQTIEAMQVIKEELDRGLEENKTP